MTPCSFERDIVFKCEQFLFHEAYLLDNWLLDDWFSLFEEGGSYEMPSPKLARDATSDEAIFLVSDDYERLRQRVVRLNSDDAHAEYPRAKCTRSLSNIVVTSVEERLVAVRSVFQTYRSKDDRIDCYFGHHEHHLVQVDECFRIRRKRTLLGMSSIRPHGRVSIIV